MNKIDERKDARRYALTRPRTPSSESDANRDLNDVRSSLYNQSASPSRSPSPNKKTAASPDKRLGSSGMGIRSIGSSDAGGGRKEPQTINLIKV